ncbi:DUF3142 domain-containing protein [Yokenella regensburgei]|uniref:DUF3142 domain-containing protein n=1 Tax=Yokenella regensburgei TaxID=158877 RepID=UPI003F179FC6
MGTTAQILLVITALLLPHATRAAVNAEAHRAFWLWSGVKPSTALKGAQTLYLHQAEIVQRPSGVVFQKVGLPVSQLIFPQLWLTVRIETLDVPDAFLQRMTRLLDNWQSAGNHVVGLQIDFDAASHRLDNYAVFLRRVRTQLPSQYALGVTGLLDWAKTGNIDVLNTLPVDELVIQSYQGRKTVPNYSEYLPALSGLRIPFKLGLVQGGEWDTTRVPHFSEHYRGTVVFMVNPVRR